MNETLAKAIKNRKMNKITVTMHSGNENGIQDESDEQNKDLGIAPETEESKAQQKVPHSNQTPSEELAALKHPQLENTKHPGTPSDNNDGDASDLSSMEIVKSAIGGSPSLNINKNTLSGKAKARMLAKLHGKKG